MEKTNKKNQRTKRNVMVSAVLAILLCIGIIVGATFALFTSEDKVNVSVTSGNVEITAVASDLVTYSGKDLTGNADVDADRIYKVTELGYENLTFANGGTAKSSTGKDNEQLITLDKMTPGDKVTFTLTLTNFSNVKTKYRMSVQKVSDDTEDPLFDVLSFDIAGFVSDGYSTWKELDAADATTGSSKIREYSCYIELPTTVGSKYRNKSCQIAFKVEQVQGNAKTVDVDENTKLSLFEVNDIDDFMALQSNYTSISESGVVKLMDDIDLKDQTWAPIGNGTRSGQNVTGDVFKATFDGAGHTISNLSITSTSNVNSGIGLFGTVDGGTVKNLKLDTVNVSVSSADNIGAAVGILLNGGKVENVEVSSGTVLGTDGVGGVVGRILASGSVIKCTNNAKVTSGSAVGGVVGKAYYTKEGAEMNIIDCTNTGAVEAQYAAGGIVGYSASNIIDCTNSGIITISGTNVSSAGGIVGEQNFYGEISGNTNTADITFADGVSGNCAVGGIVGWIRYLSSGSYVNQEVITVNGNTNSGSISITGTAAGGIVGLAYNQAVITGNTNTAASISATGTFAAGIATLQSNDNNATIGKPTVENPRFIVSGNKTTTTSVTADCNAPVVYSNGGGGNDFAKIVNNDPTTNDQQ